MSDYDKEILQKFSAFNLVELQSHWVLLDVNDEYPDNFFEYYTPNLTLVFFPTKSYEEVREIFEIVSDEWIFTINEVDNFWEESFYVNLDTSYDDWSVRIVFTKNNRSFWLKFPVSQYRRIKWILDRI
jgi:hypothetical protein